MFYILVVVIINHYFNICSKQKIAAVSQISSTSSVDFLKIFHFLSNEDMGSPIGK